MLDFKVWTNKTKKKKFLKKGKGYQLEINECIRNEDGNTVVFVVVTAVGFSVYSKQSRKKMVL